MPFNIKDLCYVFFYMDLTLKKMYRNIAFEGQIKFKIVFSKEFKRTIQCIYLPYQICLSDCVNTTPNTLLVLPIANQSISFKCHVT